MTKWTFITSATLIWQLVFSGFEFTFCNTGPKDITLRFGNSLEEILRNWKLKTLIGQDEYKVIRRETGNILHILSNKSASILFKNIEFDLKEYPVIRWHWLVNKFPEYEGTNTDEYTIDDYAARLCVVFPSWSIWTTKFLVYVWDDRGNLVGEEKPSSFSKNCKIIVVRTGKDKKGSWVTEERNIIEDYETVFGKKPPKKAGGIGLMSDSDDTMTSTDACYYNIYLKNRS